MNMPDFPFLWQKGPYSISTEKQWLDEEVIFTYLSEESYWAQGIDRETVRKSIAHTALCFGVYLGIPGEAESRQIGFARVISDLATFGYLADVFILDAYRGEGIGKWLMDTIVHHPELQGIRRFLLVTHDAHGLYNGFGFAPLSAPEKMMERLKTTPVTPTTQ